MASKEQAQRKDKDAARQRPAQPEAENLEPLNQQTNLSTLIQQARLEANPLSPPQVQRLL